MPDDDVAPDDDVFVIELPKHTVNILLLTLKSYNRAFEEDLSLEEWAAICTERGAFQMEDSLLDMDEEET